MSEERLCKNITSWWKLTEQETEIYNSQGHCHDKHAYLHSLMEEVQKGTRHMYVYDPLPAAPARVETGEARIATIRAEQNKTQHIAKIRAGLPERIQTG